MTIQLDFTSRVLGPKAVAQLKAHQVTQTIRSPNSSLVKQLPASRVVVDSLIEVTLDGEIIGRADSVAMDGIYWHDLDIEDAHRGGFDNRFELASALKRAGYRFKDLEEYGFYRIQFIWLEAPVI